MKRSNRDSAAIVCFATILIVVGVGAIHSVRNDPAEADKWNETTLGSQCKTYYGIAAEDLIADSDTIDFRDHRQIMVRVASGGITTLQPYVAGAPYLADGTTESTFRVLHNQAGTLLPVITLTSAADWQVLEEELFPAGAVRFLADADGTIDVCIKG